ncbi:MAG: ADOP family duplicated permease [Gemmatimonadota bacterium]
MSWMHGVGERVRALFNRSEEERDLDEEVRFHLEMEERKLVGEGMTQPQARREARRRFGGEDRMKERTRDERGTRVLEDLIQDSRYGARSLARSPGFTVTAVVTLALGIGAATAVFSLVDGVLLRPLPYTGADRLVEIRELGQGRRFFPSFPNFLDWRDRAASFDGMVAVQTMGMLPVLDAGDPVRVPFLQVSRDFMATAGVTPFLGRDLAGEEHVPGGPDVALVSHRFWQTRLGADPDLDRLGFNAFGSRFRVVGVLPRGFRLLYDADVYISAERWPGTVRSAHAYRVVGRMKRGVSVAVADQELDAVTAAMAEEYGGDTSAETAQVRSLRDVLLGNQRRPLILLLVASGLVLAVACANVAGTLLARGSGRRRELAVRASLGGRRARLVRLLLTENGLLAVLAGALGAALAWIAVRAAVVLAPGVLPRLETVSVDARALAFAAATALGTTLVFGLWPALHLTRTGTADGLRAGGRGRTTRRARAWDVLIAGEVALALVLLVGAGLLVRSLLTIVTLDAGWEPKGVLQMTLTPPSGVFTSEEAAVAYVRRVEEELAELPGVTDVGIGNLGPLDAGNWTAPARDADTGGDIGGYAGWRLVDAGYFPALGVSLVKGRLFKPGDQGVAVVNEAFARGLWGEDDALGKRVVSNFDPRMETLEVVGVVRQARDWRFAAEEQMEMFVPWWRYTQQVNTLRYLVRTTGDPGDLIAPARERVSALEARIPLEFTTLEDEFADSTAERRFVAGILLTFAATGLLLSLVGIFGVVSYAVAQRRREIGIRMALGARSDRVRAEARASALGPAVAGLLLGGAGAMLLSRFVEALLYEGVPPRDPVLYLGVAVVFLAAAAAASDLPARRAASADPAMVLREE